MKAAARAIPAIVVGGLLLVLAFLLAGDRIGEIRLGLRSADWPSVEGEIVRSGVAQRGGSRQSGGTSRLTLEYRYAVGGTEYRGERVAFTAIRVDRVPDEYPAGSVVPVYHDPGRPGVSVLEPGVTGAGVLASLAPFLVLSVLGLALDLWGTYLLIRR